MMQDSIMTHTEGSERRPIQRGSKLPRRNPMADNHNFTRNPTPPAHKLHHVAQAQYHRATQALTNHGVDENLEM